MVASVAVATVVAITGTVYARNADGQLRPLKVGDVLLNGEVLVTPEGSSAELETLDGELLSSQHNADLLISRELLVSEQGLAQEEASIEGGSAQQLIQALAQGQDLSELLEPTAAGNGAGGGANSGHDFILLGRVAESVSELFGGLDQAAAVTAESVGFSAGVEADDSRDLTEPDAPSIALVNDSGIAGDLITNDGALSVTGVEPGATVEYSTDGSTWSSSFTPVEGENTVYVRQTDVAGNTSGSSSLTFTLDTQVAAPSVALVTDSNVGDDLITNDGALSVTGVEPGATVEYSTDGSTWSSSFTPVEGENTVYVRQTDVAGNTSGSSSLTFTLDTGSPNLVIGNNAAGDSITFTFSEQVTGFELGDITTTGGVLSNLTSSDGGMTWSAEFAPQADFDGDATFVVADNVYTDLAGNNGTGDSHSLAVDTLATPPTLTFNDKLVNNGTNELDLPESTGLLLSFYDELGNSDTTAANQEAAIDAAEPTAQARVFDGLGTTKVLTDTETGTVQTDGSTVAIDTGDSYAVTGFIYLEAGSTYQFSGYHDDSLRIELGGTKLVSTTGDSYGNYGQSSGVGSGADAVFTAQYSGYYTLEVFVNNISGIGQFSLNLSKDGAPAQELTASNFHIYASAADLEAVGAQMGDFVDAGDNAGGGYFPESINTGLDGTYIELSNISATVNDADGSESIQSISISDIPVGAVLTDGVGGHSFTATAGNTSVDLAGWDLTDLHLLPPAGSSGEITLKVTAVSVESGSGSTASTTENLVVTVADPSAAKGSLDQDLVGSEIISGTPAGDTLSGGALKVSAIINTSDTGNDPDAYGFVYSAGAAGLSITSISLNISADNNAVFDFDSYGPVVGSASTVSASGWTSSADDALTIFFAEGAFQQDGQFYFGVDTDNVRDGRNSWRGDRGGDFGGEATVTVTFSDGTSQTETFVKDSTNKSTAEIGVESSAVLIDGGEGNDQVSGSSGSDLLIGGEGDDSLTGGAGNDVLTGGAGADTFIWNQGDDAISGLPGHDAPASDRVTDFSVAEGDVLNIADLLDGNASSDPDNADSIGNLLNYLDISSDGTDTVVNISSTGQFDPSTSDFSAVDQTITLENIYLGNDSAAIIQQLINNGNLLTD